MRLLVAIDLHAETRDVLAQAVGWAGRLGATLDLLYVDDTPDAAVFVGDPHVRAIVVEERKALVERHTSAVTELLQEIPAAHRGVARCIAGVAANTVADVSEGYDAIVLATHGRTGLSHLWMGSVAEKVVRTAPVPVIVLRLQDED